MRAKTIDKWNLEIRSDDGTKTPVVVPDGKAAAQ
jgi:hypothetical protein